VAAKKKEKTDGGFDDSVVGRRVWGTRESDGATRKGTLVERLLTTARNRNTFRVRYDDGVTEEVNLPDEAVELIPEDDAGLDENSGLSLEEQRRAWKEEAAQAEAQAKEDLAIEGKRGRAQNSAHPV
jgi:hypothetical protein